MTRINTINALCLADQHLMAEYLEFSFAVSIMRKSYIRKGLKEIQTRYTRGKGNVLFFKNKLAYLKSRYEEIKAELIRIQFNINGFSLDFNGLLQIYLKPYFLFLLLYTYFIYKII